MYMQDFVRIPVTDIFPATNGAPQFLLVLDTSQSPAVPIPIKLGDVNQDGFPDILAVLASGTSSRSDRTPRLAYSVTCGKGKAGCRSDGSGHNGWDVLQKGAEVLSEVKDARSVALLDMDEDVSVDVYVEAASSSVYI